MTPAETIAPPKPTVARRLLRVLGLLVAAPTLGVLLLTVLSFFASYWWRAEQVCHFRLQYGWLLMIAACVLLVCRERRLGMIAGMASAVNLALVLPIYLPANQPTKTGATWKLISYNVLTDNNRYADVLAMLRKEQADVVLVCEVSHEWGTQLDSLGDVYPHRHIVPQDNSSGIALLSRVPFHSIETQQIGPARIPSIVAKFTALGTPFTLIGTHPFPPGSRRMAEMRNEQLQAIAKTAAKSDHPVIIAGDLNITSYSPFFHDLLRDGKLRDSRQGLGVQASWSPRIPLLFSIPIDHCLVSPSIEVVSRRVGEKLGSDHRPVIVELR